MLRPEDFTVSHNQLVEPFAVTSMDWAGGTIVTFSPELLGLEERGITGVTSCLETSNRDSLAELPASR